MRARRGSSSPGSLTQSLESAFVLGGSGLELAEIGYRADAVRHELRLLLVAHGYAAAHDDGRVILDVDAAGVQRALERDQLHRAGVVLEIDVAHERVRLRRARAA